MTSSELTRALLIKVAITTNIQIIQPCPNKTLSKQQMNCHHDPAEGTLKLRLRQQGCIQDHLERDDETH